MSLKWKNNLSSISTSFLMPHGQFEFLRMPFDLKNGPPVYQHFIYICMYSVLSDFIKVCDMMMMVMDELHNQILE